MRAGYSTSDRVPGAFDASIRRLTGRSKGPLRRAFRFRSDLLGETLFADVAGVVFVNKANSGGPGRYAKLRVGVLEVLADRRGRDPERGGDLGVSVTLGDEREDLSFTCRQAERPSLFEEEHVREDAAHAERCDVLDVAEVESVSCEQPPRARRRELGAAVCVQQNKRLVARLERGEGGYPTPPRAPGLVTADEVRPDEFENRPLALAEVPRSAPLAKRNIFVCVKGAGSPTLISCVNPPTRKRSV